MNLKTIIEENKILEPAVDHMERNKRMKEVLKEGGVDPLDVIGRPEQSKEHMHNWCENAAKAKEIIDVDEERKKVRKSGLEPRNRKSYAGCIARNGLGQSIGNYQYKSLLFLEYRPQ